MKSLSVRRVSLLSSGEVRLQGIETGDVVLMGLVKSGKGTILLLKETPTPAQRQRAHRDEGADPRWGSTSLHVIHAQPTNRKGIWDVVAHGVCAPAFRGSPELVLADLEKSCW